MAHEKAIFHESEAIVRPCSRFDQKFTSASNSAAAMSRVSFELNACIHWIIAITKGMSLDFLGLPCRQSFAGPTSEGVISACAKAGA